MNLEHTARVIALTVLCVGFAFSLAKAGELPEVGKKAPDVTLPSQDGSNVSLKSFRGKWVVLYFYPKDNTPGCTIEAHNFQRDLSKYEEKNAVILGVSVDSSESHQDFCTKQSLTFKLLADTEKKVVAEYGSLSDRGFASRNTFLIDPKGKIAKVWTGVKPSEHSDEVLATLSELQKN
ncbi:MAG TPA: peroxiredoxin [Terriglobia bacterium]|nr:peroxiredoxin [Terriglobia bacterium]